MQHRALGRPLLGEHAQHVVVAVAVVDLQGPVEPLGEVDVPAERVLLRGHALRPGAVVVEPGLPHDPHPRVRREPLDLGVGRVETARSPPAPAPRWGAARPRRAPRRTARPPRRRSGRRARSHPTCTTRSTPTEAASRQHRRRGRRPRPPSPSRLMSRWVWLSTTGIGSGSGGSGAPRRLGCDVTGSAPPPPGRAPRRPPTRRAW